MPFSSIGHSSVGTGCGAAELAGGEVGVCGVVLGVADVDGVGPVDAVVLGVLDADALESLDALAEGDDVSPAEADAVGDWVWVDGVSVANAAGADRSASGASTAVAAMARRSFI
ncbi:hypothetical protein [Streptomyces cavernae]|uniref:hypothetical protein n=1 Tax=Streptomyces cavernae TaxID=2259034 RepID=UPI001EE44924|nr:hypothetical protein [Streptomyces cavernae]